MQCIFKVMYLVYFTINHLESLQKKCKNLKSVIYHMIYDTIEH